MKKRKVTLTLETERLLVLSELGGTAWCSRCSRLVGAATPGEIAAALGITPDSLNRRMAQRPFHYVDGIKSLRLICLRSMGQDEKEEQDKGPCSLK